MKLFRKTLKTAKKQKGFTLIELAIVGLFLGVLAVFAVARFAGGAVDTQRANAVNDVATKLADTWSTLANTCNIPADITQTAVGAGSSGNAKQNVSLLLGTTTPVAGYQACYTSSGIKPLAGLTSGAAGAEVVTPGYSLGTVTYSSQNGNSYIKVQFLAVPENVVLGLYKKLSSASGASTATALPASDATDPAVQFSAAASGSRTVTLIKAL